MSIVSIVRLRPLAAHWMSTFRTLDIYSPQCITNPGLEAGSELEGGQQGLILPGILVIWLNHLDNLVDLVDALEVGPEPTADRRNRRCPQRTSILVNGGLQDTRIEYICEDTEVEAAFCAAPNEKDFILQARVFA